MKTKLQIVRKRNDLKKHLDEQILHGSYDPNGNKQKGIDITRAELNMLNWVLF